MKALLVNGSPHAKGCTYTALAELKKNAGGRGHRNGADPRGE